MYRLLNALCQICAFALDLNGYSKEFMFGSSWAVSLEFLKVAAASPLTMPSSLPLAQSLFCLSSNTGSRIPTWEKTL